ncbi:MAG: IS1634 family transposase, partial [Pirellulales bacterium]
SYRENGRVKNRTLANISHLPLKQIDLLSRVLKGEGLVPAETALRITASLPHGHVQAVLEMCAHLKLPELIASRRCRERDLVLAMIVQRILYPGSKLATTRLWRINSLGKELGVADAEVDELYAALDWLLARQNRIENKLARRHLQNGDPVHYDVSSSSYTGATCVLARFGHNRDGRRDLPCIVYGVMTDEQGRPVSVDVYPGNTGDPTTVPDQLDKLRTRFRLERVVAVGDRGMLTQAQITTLRQRPGLGWLSALRSGAIRGLIDKGRLERSLFDEANLAEISSPDFPEERLVACYNPLLAERRRRKREALLAATEDKLARIAREVGRRTKKPLRKDESGLKVGRVLNKHKVGKHFRLTIDDGVLRWERKQQAIEQEMELDGIYVIRTSEPAERLTAENAVRGYKRLADVEQAFRSLKSLELLLRPIHRRLEERVRAHIFLCLLAYYVQWHLKRAWAPLLFADENLDAHRAERDPVAPAEPADEVTAKKIARVTPDGHEIQSFRTLLAALGAQCRNICELGASGSTVEVDKVTDPTPLQSQAFSLLRTY